MEHFLLLAVSLFAVIHGAQFATHYAEKVAEGFRLSRYVVGFIVVSFISILPETFIAVDAAIQGDAAFGLSTLIGSNVADLTLIFAILVFVTTKGGIRVEKGMLKKLYIYPLFLAIPLLLGSDGYFSRADGLTLIAIGVIFYLFVFKKSVGVGSRSVEVTYMKRNMLFLILSMALLLAGAHFTVEAAQELAGQIGVSTALIGILVVSLGTTIPELMFSYRAVKNKNYGLAVGDMLGSVLADATIVIGVVSLIQPFHFPERIIYVAGGFMVCSAVLLLVFMRSGFAIKRREALLLVAVWVAYIASELLVSV